MATPVLLKIKISKNDGYDVIIIDYHVTNKILSRDSNWIDFIRICPEKSLFLRGGLGSSSIIWDWH